MDEDRTEAFRSFLQGWMDTTGWSQFQLAMATGIGQSIISRWLSPDQQRRTEPSEKTLRKLAPVVGRSWEDLMRMTGHWSDSTIKTDENALPPELAALLSDIEVGWMAADTTSRAIGARVARAAFHTPRRRNRDPQEHHAVHTADAFASNLPDYAGLDHYKNDSSKHTAHA